MVKSRPGGLSKEQRCHFLIGPISSWFVSSATDIWTKPKELSEQSSPDYDGDRESAVSYFIYGSIGCFCYGSIYHQGDNRSFALVNHLIDVKEDNSRVSCARFLKSASYPLAMILTESGTLVIHDCGISENLIHYKKQELVTKFISPIIINPEDTFDEPCNKRAKFNITQQVNSCTWPDPENAFIGISMLKEKTNHVVWLKLKDLTKMSNRSCPSITKTDFIDSFEELKLSLPEYSSPICCMEAAMLDMNICLISVAMDDGLIVVLKVDFEKGQTRRPIILARHKEQVCSMSFYLKNTKKFPLGLLASASREGLVLIWDIENEFYFADYVSSPSDMHRSHPKINWFALSFIFHSDSKASLVVGNPDSGLTILDIPENTRSKVRLREDSKEKNTQRKYSEDHTIRHHALLFNIVFDSTTSTLMTSSLDGNHIFWKCNQLDSSYNGKRESSSIDIRPHYLYPSMTNNSRTHMLRFSPIKEDFLGAALGKAGLRFYKVAKSHGECRFDMSQSCVLLARKVNKANLSPTSLSWHPSHEYRVAIGTLEGKVLRADLTPRKCSLVEAEHQYQRKPRSISQVGGDNHGDDIFEVEYQPLEHDAENNDHQNYNSRSKTDGVYSICWGPNPTCPQDISRLAIYAIGSMSHRLFIYYSKKENGDKISDFLDEFQDQSLPEAFEEASEVCWKSSMDLMALGTINGEIIIVSYLGESLVELTGNNLFRKIAVIQGALGNTYIQCLSWHPTKDEDDPHYYQIAASANESPVFVYNLKESILIAGVRNKLKIDESLNDERDDPERNAVPKLSEYLYKLDGHKKAISDIAWNPHNPNELATASFDRSCFAWSLTGVDGPYVKSRFAARDRLFTLEWSLVDDDLIFTSGHDSTVWAWRPSENESKSFDTASN